MLRRPNHINYKNNCLETYVYLFLFALLSLMIVMPFIHMGKINALSDWQFHASRVEQIFENLKEGELFSFIASSTFHSTGVGSFLFYPTIFLYPWAVLRFVVNPITAFYLWYSLITFICFVSSFYCMKRMKKNDRLAFIFSIVYTLNAYRLYLGNFVFGEFIAASFLPIAFLGFYIIFFEKNNDGGEKYKAVLIG